MLHRVTIVSVAWLVGVQAPAVAQPQVPTKTVDAIFSRWNNTTPGCAVGVAVGGTPTLLRAYGMADLEHDVPNTPDTIFEAGSVAKQFTAMAVLLLAGDGRLSLDDPARTYVPELPDYGPPLTIRHMLTHTSGLRDWGSVAAIAGAPRTTRAYTHDHVLDIVSRQKALNFPPGTNWSYSNTGFNLAAIIVSRVSGMSFAEFSQRRIFTPLGMTRTAWRDDHRRIVKGRATAYATPGGSSYRIEMPFENVHGNGGLLTTVGDLLKWNENFVAPKVGTRALLAEMQRVARLADGRELDYALGLYARTEGGVRNVFHSGSTAGYRAHLNRFPEAHTSVAVLCNASDGQATDAAARVSRLYLADRLAPNSGGVPGDPAGERDAPWPPLASLRELSGDYRSDEAEVTLTAVIEKNELVLKRRPGDTLRLGPRGRDAFQSAIGRVTFLRNAAGAVVGLSVRQDRVWDLRFERR